MFIYIVNTHGEIHNILLIWGYSLCKKFSSTIFRTSALVFMGLVFMGLVFMGCVQMAVKDYKVVLTLLSPKLTLFEKALLIMKQ